MTGRHQGRRRRVRPGPADPAAARTHDGAPLRFGQLPYLAVVCGVLAALVIIRQGVHLVQSGTLVLAGVILLAALARLILPERRAGMLASRRRLLDVTIFGVLGIGLLIAGLVVPVPG